MTPAEPRRYRRKGFRQTRRGIPTGRRATHTVQTTYGHRQEARDRAAAFSAACAERREASAVMAGEEQP